MIARKTAPAGAPTVLLYAHHDVQPENDHADWDSPPFEPTERDGRLYGRGAADDKAGIVAHLARCGCYGDDLPVSVTHLHRGRGGGRLGHPARLLEEHQERLEADVIVIADSGNWDIGVPALTTSLRGLVRVDVEVRTLTHAVHSGMWGGLVPDALITLSRLIASLHDDAGNVAVAGLHSGPAADVEYPEERLRAESGAAPGIEWIGDGSDRRAALDQARAHASPASTRRRSTARATRWSPPPGPRSRMRIAPGDTTAERPRPPARATSRRTCRGAPSSPSHGRRHRRGHPDRRHRTGVRRGARGVHRGLGRHRAGRHGRRRVDPVHRRVPRGVPEASVLVTGVEDPDTRAHGANEGLHLAEFERVVLAEALLLEKLGAR